MLGCRDVTVAELIAKLQTLRPDLRVAMIPNERVREVCSLWVVEEGSRSCYVMLDNMTSAREDRREGR